MSKHWCQGNLHRVGQHWWGDPNGKPLCEPVPAEVFEKFPDVITDWGNCDRCGEAVCGKPARFRIVVQEPGGEEETIWLCADHSDEQALSELPVWHEC